MSSYNHQKFHLGGGGSVGVRPLTGGAWPHQNRPWIRNTERRNDVSLVTFSRADPHLLLLADLEAALGRVANTLAVVVAGLDEVLLPGAGAPRLRQSHAPDARHLDGRLDARADRHASLHERQRRRRVDGDARTGRQRVTNVGVELLLHVRRRPQVVQIDDRRQAKNVLQNVIERISLCAAAQHCRVRPPSTHQITTSSRATETI